MLEGLYFLPRRKSFALSDRQQIPCAIGHPPSNADSCPTKRHPCRYFDKNFACRDINDKPAGRG
jgi:hypothetical protein